MSNGYLKIEVSTARPELLIARLLERAVGSIRSAREADPTCDAVTRTRAIAKALDIISELRGALDFDHGQELAQNLDAVYEFVNHRLLQASVDKADIALAEALRPLEIVSSGWLEMCNMNDPELAR